MTTILYVNDRVYADSRHYKDGEVFESLTKVQKFWIPRRIFQDEAGMAFDDIVYGWVCTGALASANAFVEMITDYDEGENSSKATAFYREVVKQQLAVTSYNTFEVIFIGKKANHSFQFTTDGFSYREYANSMMFAMGSGNSFVTQYMKAYDDPIRAMMETFYIDEMSGGIIDIWKVDRETEGLNFMREGIVEPLERHLIPIVLEKFNRDKKMGCQLIRYTDEMFEALEYVKEQAKKKQESKPKRTPKKSTTQRTSTSTLNIRKETRYLTGRNKETK